MTEEQDRSADRTDQTSLGLDEQTMEEGDQEVVTLKDVLQDEEQLMDDANAVLGALDDKKCTYSEGYMKRQALYSCLTCIPETRTDLTAAAGVCLACCLHCHDGHDLVELYTKRNFRCDCGNTKFSNSVCTLESAKATINELNQYNQNFSGLYCTCSRPYPDPEDPVEDDMIQCIICEDWYHSRHLGVATPGQSYSEMICESCVRKHQFLLNYDGLSITKPKLSSERREVEVDDETVAQASKQTEDDPLKLDDKMELDGSSKDDAQVNGDNSDKCMMPKTKSVNVCTKYWPDVEWRNELCTCTKCFKMYEDENVTFLLDPQDTVQVYEERGKAMAREFQEKQEENDMRLLNSLDRVPLMETIAGFNDMKDNLKEYLKKFAENKKVVREEDIREFFAQYDSKKKQKCEIPTYCR